VEEEKVTRAKRAPKNRHTCPFCCCRFDLVTDFSEHFRADFPHLQIVGQNLINGGVS